MGGDEDLDQWFTNEILPLEPALIRFLRHNGRDEAEVADLRQEAYARVYEAAGKERPYRAKAFLFQTVRNLMIDRLRESNVVPIDAIADFELLNISSGEPTPEQQTAARQQLRQLQVALDSLPPRCREVIVLRKIEGLSQREVARRMNIAEETVEHQMSKGIRLLAQSIFGPRGPLVAGAKRYLAANHLKIQ
jgi:RNA polymerase sigma factor (sigma-70 family)